MHKKTPMIAILTGDLVGASKAPPEAVEAALTLIHHTVEDFCAAIGADRSRFTRSRGDGWQASLSQPAAALRLAVIVAARLRGSAALPPTRMAIGLGTASNLGSNDLSDGAGAAFVASGRGLDQLKGQRPELAIAGDGVGPLHQLAVDLIDLRLGRWTREQAEAAAHFLAPDAPSMVEIARRLSISPQAVSYRLAGADAARIAGALSLWEAASIDAEAAR